jgi:hypothetical protein
VDCGRPLQEHLSGTVRKEGREGVARFGFLVVAPAALAQHGLDVAQAFEVRGVEAHTRRAPPAVVLVEQQRGLVLVAS